MSSSFSSLSVLLKSRKLRQVAMPADGNCFYRAVAAAYHGDQDMHHMLRRALMDYILEEKSQFQALFESPRSFTGTVVANRRAGVWNSDLADLVPAAIATYLGARVEVYSVQKDESVKRYVFGSEGGGERIRILHHDNHYDLLTR